MVKSEGSMPVVRERIPHVDDPVDVGRRLTEAREAVGLSQRELAFPGCTPAYISRIERGERVPSLQVLRELARRCEVSETFLAWGRSDHLDATVEERIRALHAAEASGSASTRAAAYAALARASNRAARALRP
jgi:transcriptional regulator with XRE-family HTH domain